MTQQELQQLPEDNYTLTDGSLDYDLIVYKKGSAFGFGCNSKRFQMSITENEVCVYSNVGSLNMSSTGLPTGFRNLKLKK